MARGRRNILVALTLLATMFVTVGGGAQAQGLCDGKAPTIVGGHTGQVINGTNGNDVIWAGEGDNLVNGGNGNDTICAGDGDNQIHGGNGNDVIIAGNGSNTVTGGAGNDKITTGSGDDTIAGNDGNDVVIDGGGSNDIDGGAGNDHIAATGPGNNSVTGGAGNDMITTGDGDDHISGDEGNDTIATGNGTKAIHGGAGNDTIASGAGHNVIHGGAGNDAITTGDGDKVVYGQEGNDAIATGDGDDHLEGGAGNDNLNGGPGENTLDGGAGNDTCTNGPLFVSCEKVIGDPGATTTTTTTTTTPPSTTTTTAPDQAPTVHITTPVDGAQFYGIVAIDLGATASDPEDGDLTNAIAWSMGSTPLGTGGSASLGVLPLGNYTVTAAVTDSAGHTVSDEVTFHVVQEPVILVVSTTHVGPIRDHVVPFAVTVTGAVTGTVYADLADAAMWSLHREDDGTTQPAGTGATVDVGPLAAGGYVIEASVDTGGGEPPSTAQMAFTVEAMCVVHASFTPPGGQQIPQLLPLNAGGSSDSCDRPLRFHWDCQSSTSVICPEFIAAANANDFTVSLPFLNLQTFDEIAIALNVCAVEPSSPHPWGDCAPPITHVYIGAVTSSDTG